MNEVEVAWVAGLLEGEGSFLTQTNCYSPKVSCQMTDKDVLDKLVSIAGGTMFMVTKRQEHWKDCWAWRISGDPAAELIKSLLPHLGERRRQRASEVLENWYKNGRPYRKSTVIRDQAAQEYLDGIGSLRAIAKKYGISYESVRRRALILKTS